MYVHRLYLLASFNLILLLSLSLARCLFLARASKRVCAASPAQLTLMRTGWLLLATAVLAWAAVLVVMMPAWQLLAWMQAALETTNRDLTTR